MPTPPFLLSQPEPMLKARIITVKDEVNKVLAALHASQAIHVKEAKELKPLERELIERRRGELENLLRIIDRFLMNVSKEYTVEIEEKIEPYTIPELLEKYEKPVRDIYAKMQTLANKISNIQQKLFETETKVKYLEALSKVRPSLKIIDLDFKGKVIFSKTIVVPKERKEDFEGKIRKVADIVAEAELTEPPEIIYVIAGLLRKYETIARVVRELGLSILYFERKSILISDYVKKLREKTVSLKNELNKLNREFMKLIEDNLKQVLILKILLENEMMKLNVLEKAAGAKYVTLIEGWVPESLRKKLLYELHSNVKFFHVSFEKARSEENPPTKMKNLNVLKYFEPLVKFYGVPKYTEWDPTPLVAYSFSIFFGLMLGDVIYGILMLLAIKYVLDKLVDNPESENYLTFKKMLYVSGFASIVAGFLYGSYLGDTLKLLGINIPPIVPQFTDPLSLIFLSMGIGLVHVNIAHFLGLIKALHERDKITIASKVGLFITEIFGIPYVLFKMANFKVFPMPDNLYNILIYGVVIGIVFLVYSQVMSMKFFGILMWIFDITGLLGDIMSYTRIAGVAFATIYLASCFNLMTRMIITGFQGILPGIAGLALGLLFGAAVFFLGHLLNLALSIVGPFIHSLRLCFVEFLPKFYEGGGIEYSPLRLVLRRRIIVKPP